jgi:hypothetical protein
MFHGCKQKRYGDGHAESIHHRHVRRRVTRKVFGTRQVDTVCADVYFGHRWTKGLELTKRQIFFAEKYADDVDDDVSNLLLTDESEMFQKLSNVGFHDILYRNVYRVIKDGFDVAFGDNVEKGEEPTGTRS